MLRNKSRFQTVHLVYGLVALVVLLPLLAPGHVMTLDMAFTPRLPMPELTTSSFLFRFFLHVLNAIIPSDIIGKGLLFAFLLLSGIGMHRLMEYIKPARASEPYTQWAPYVAGLFYMINPFVYSRFMTGQYSVLLGYAMFPFFLRALLTFMTRPAWPTVLRLTAWGVAIGVVSIHSIGLMAVLGSTSLLFFGWRYRHQKRHLLSIVKYGAAGLALAGLVNSHWLVPLTLGTSDTAQVIGAFDADDQQAFATTGGSISVQLVTISSLQGFWAEARDLFTSPQDVIPLWALVGVFVWVLVIRGGISLWRQGRRPETALLGTSAIIAAFLSTNLINWFDWVPGLAGFREPHKFVGLVALCYAVFAGAGAAALIRKHESRSRTFRAQAATALCLMLPVLFTPTMFWGGMGQLKPRHYPTEWFAMNDRLGADKQNFRILFLPWHRYMRFRFSGRIIMNPATHFFDKPIVASLDPEFGGAAPDQPDPLFAYIDTQVLPDAASQTNLGAKLAPKQIKYVLLAKEVDADRYTYLDSQEDLHLIHEDDAFKLYYNRAWE